MATTNQTQERSGTGRITTSIVALFVAALVGFAVGWLAFGNDSSVPSDVEDVTAGYIEAWNDGDGEAVLQYMTTRGVHVSSGTPTTGVSGERLASYVSSVGGPGFGYEGGTLAVSGDGPYIVVEEATLGGTDGFSTYHIQDVDGELKISKHVWSRS